MPHLVEMQQKFEGDLLVVGVTKVGPDATRTFADELGVTYPLLPNGAATFEAFGVSSIPQGFLVDPTGRIVSDDNSEFESLLE